VVKALINSMVRISVVSVLQWSWSFVMSFLSLEPQRATIAWYCNEIFPSLLNLWGRLSSLPPGLGLLAGWKACPTELDVPRKSR
jgi:hypothetical protein